MKILYITPSCIGDVVLTTGVLDFFLRKNPKAHLTIATPHLTASLFADLPQLQEIFCWEKRPYKKHWWDLWRNIVGKKWDLILDFRGSAISHCLLASQRIIWQPQNIFGRHKIMQMADLVGNGTTAEDVAPRLWFSAKTYQQAHIIMGAAQPVLAVAPIANWRGKQWPIEFYAELLQGFFRRFPTAKAAIFAAPHERSQATFLFQRLPQGRLIDCMGTEPLLVKAACIQGAPVFLGNDSGLMHISAAVKTVTIGLFGPTNEKIYGPWGPQGFHTALRGKPYDGILNRPDFSHAAQNICYMKDLLVEPVEAALFAKWQAQTHLSEPTQITKYC